MTTITLENGEVLDLSAYPMPEGSEDEVLNRDQLARAMGTSVVTISKWVDEGMPVAQRGGNGQAYQFVYSHCRAWRLWRDGKDQQERREKDDRARQFSMEWLGDDEGRADQMLTPKQVKEWSEAELIRNRAAEQRGELVRSAQMQDVLDRVLVSFRTAVMNLPDWLEQEFSLSPHQVDKAQRFCDGILSEARRQISDAGFAAGDVVSIERRQDG